MTALWRQLGAGVARGAAAAGCTPWWHSLAVLGQWSPVQNASEDRPQKGEHTVCMASGKHATGFISANMVGYPPGTLLPIWARTHAVSANVAVRAEVSVPCSRAVRDDVDMQRCCKSGRDSSAVGLQKACGRQA